MAALQGKAYSWGRPGREQNAVPEGGATLLAMQKQGFSPYSRTQEPGILNVIIFVRRGRTLESATRS